jgi:hypothetical protein
MSNIVNDMSAILSNKLLLYSSGILVSGKLNKSEEILSYDMSLISDWSIEMPNWTH